MNGRRRSGGNSIWFFVIGLMAGGAHKHCRQGRVALRLQRSTPNECSRESTRCRRGHGRVAFTLRRESKLKGAHESEIYRGRSSRTSSTLPEAIVMRLCSLRSCLRSVKSITTTTITLVLKYFELLACCLGASCGSVAPFPGEEGSNGILLSRVRDKNLAKQEKSQGFPRLCPHTEVPSTERSEHKGQLPHAADHV